MSGIVRSKGAEPMIIALASGLNYKDAAEKAGINERTVRRRLEDPEWQEAIEEHRQKVFVDAQRAFTGKLVAAAAGLHDLAMGSESDSVRLGAWRAIVEFALRIQPGGEQSTVHSTVQAKGELDLSQSVLDGLRELNIIDEGAGK